ncbi:MAG: hypothetical protein HC905_20390 [Bacteroidales bacterium]|nr:hypothetical protein [Bacteroidales bacterium]
MYHTTNGEIDRIEDYFSISDEKMFSVTKSGWVFYIGKHFLVDVYAGIGIEYGNRKFKDSVFNPINGGADPEIFNYFSPTYFEKQQFAPRYTVGANIGFYFNRNTLKKFFVSSFD